MITLNGKKFAKNEQEFTDSLFSKGGTCSGYYKVYKTKINLYDHNMNLIGVIANKVLAKATKQDNGKYWYSYGTPDIIGDYDNYSQESAEVSNITYEHNLTIKY